VRRFRGGWPLRRHDRILDDVQEQVLESKILDVDVPSMSMRLRCMTMYALENSDPVVEEEFGRKATDSEFQGCD